MKKEINVFDYAGDICKAMKPGILITTKSGDKVNSMTIGWGMLGIDWSRPIFVAYIRESRFTKQMLDENSEFTVNIPFGNVDTKALTMCGTKSGRYMDKIAEAGLTLEEPVSISVPGIREFPLTLECKVIYKQKQDLSAIPQDIIDRYYPKDLDALQWGTEQDYHYAFYGQILNAYLIAEDA